MNNFKILAATFLLLFVCCNQPEKHIKVDFVSDKHVSDVIFTDSNLILMNEYYTLSVENLLYDTIYFGLSHLGSSKIKSVLTSKIEYYKNNKRSGDTFTCNFRMPGDSIVKIPIFHKEEMIFILPEYSDTARKKSYVFLFQSDSSGVKKFRYLRITPQGEKANLLTEIY